MLACVVLPVLLIQRIVQHVAILTYPKPGVIPDGQI